MLVEIIDKHGKGYGIGGRKPGRIMDIAGGVADTWIRRGYARPVDGRDGGEQMVPVRTDMAGRRSRRG